MSHASSSIRGGGLRTLPPQGSAEYVRGRVSLGSSLRRWEFGLLPAAIWLIVFYGYPVAGSLIESVTSFISP